jgi:hypothetical protein
MADAQGSSRNAVVWLLVASAVLAAAIGVRSQIVDSNGSGSYDSAVRQDVKRGAGVVEDLRFVYSEEGPTAFRVAEARIRADELRRAARGKSGLEASYLKGEAGAQDQIIKTLEPTVELTSSDKYDGRGDSYDLFRRLADKRKEHPDLLRVNPDATEKKGYDSSKASTLLTAATIPVGFAFLFGSLTEGFPRRRRPLLVAGWVCLAIGLVFAIVVEVAL